MTARNYIAEVQARVGCPHPATTENLGRYNATTDVWMCGQCGASFSRTGHAPAPDCSTLWGALAATRLIEREIYVSACFNLPYKQDGYYVAYAGMDCDGEYVADQRAACEAVCKLIINELEKREKSNVTKG